MEDDEKIKELVGTRTPFEVPEGYFEEFQAKLMTQLSEGEENTKHSLSLWERVRPWIYMAASFMLIAWGLKFFAWEAKNIMEARTESSYAEFWDSDDDFDCYLALNDEYMIYQSYDEP